MPDSLFRTSKRAWIACVCLLAATLSPATAAQDSLSSADAELLRRAGAAAQRLAEHLGMERHDEHLAQRKLKENDKVDYQQDAFFDSLTLVRREGGRLVADESAQKSRPSFGFEVRPLLQTSGFSTMALVLHPYYEQSFRFAVLEEEIVSGRRLRRLQFEHVKGADSPTALRLRGRNYPLDLSGTIWLDSDTASVVRIVALLSEPMEDIGLHNLICDVRYDPVALPDNAEAFWLPVSATIDLQTSKQHWRNIHTYSNYRKYSVDVLVGTGEKQ